MDMFLKMKLKENSCDEDWNQNGNNRIEKIYRKIYEETELWKN
jgi:hypothetical protein